MILCLTPHDAPHLSLESAFGAYRLPIYSHGANPAMSLVVQVLHRSQTKKKHRKPTLVGSAKLSLGEVLSRHPLPHPRPVEYDVRLSCPPPQRKSPTIGGRQQHCATLTLKFIVPHPTQTPCDSPPLSPAETDAIFSDGASCACYTTGSSRCSRPDGLLSQRPKVSWTVCCHRHQTIQSRRRPKSNFPDHQVCPERLA